MKVRLFPSDHLGCGMYRICWPGMALADKGYDVKELARPQVIMNGRKVIGLASNIDADVVVFQRPARLQYIELFKYLQSIGIKVVVDIDDDLATIHPKNTAFIPYQQLDMNWRYAIGACEMVDLVTCSTAALAEKYGKGHSVVVPNCIPERYLSIEGIKEDRTTVGWAGYVETHPEDLTITHGAVNQALAGTDAGFISIGNEKALIDLGIRNRPPHKVVSGVQIDSYPQTLAMLDIGIVPLRDSEFNRAKSWLKALEYAAVGVMPVVSPTPDNQRIVDAGAALAASNPREWQEHIKFLINNDDERKALTTKARDFARTQTIEENCERWWEAWSTLV